MRSALTRSAASSSAAPATELLCPKAPRTCGPSSTPCSPTSSRRAGGFSTTRSGSNPWRGARTLTPPTSRSRRPQRSGRTTWSSRPPLRVAVDVPRIPFRLEDVHNEDVSAATVQPDSHVLPRPQDVRAVATRSLERSEETLAAAAPAHVLPQSPPARDRAAKIAVVVDGPVPRHPASVSPGDVTELLVRV